MSDKWVTYLSLDADEKQASTAVDDIVSWLLEREVIAPMSRPDRFYGQYREGSRFAEAFDSAQVPRSAIAGGTYILFGVRAEKEWTMSTNMNGFEPPPCPQCSVPIADSRMGELMTQWNDSRTEPVTTCVECGHSDPLGNWQHILGGYCNYGSISFVNAFPLSDEFDEELLARIGPRPRKLYVHL